jgi:putative pyruvate formate lyase activating enzyme
MTMIDFPQRISALRERLAPCRLCPRRCGVDRTAGATGLCHTADEIVIASHNLHFGEEPPLSGVRGSGTIFFSHCTLSCVFCQNYPISQLGNGNRCTVDDLAGIMLELQEEGAHNINFVTPTHMTPQIVAAVAAARARGLVLPLVYNCSGYEDVDTLRLLDGIIDIYLPDMKYGDDACAERYSNAPHYWETNTRAVREMYRQVGNLRIDGDGIARRGLLVRHLILPGGLSGTRKVLEFIARELSPQIHVSLMAQYHPAHRYARFPELSRRITAAENSEIAEMAQELGIENGWQQEL